MSSSVEFQPEKFRQMILYFTQEGAGDPLFGSTRLNKQLFMADFMAYKLLGEPISGSTYVHRQFGPAPSEFVNVRESLKVDGVLAIEEIKLGKLLQKRPVLVPGTEPDLGVFNEFEQVILRLAAKEFSGLSGTYVSDWSHAFPGWTLTRESEPIPYFTVYVGANRRVSRDTLEWARNDLETHGYSELEGVAS